MKKKIILALTACLFAAGTIINMHLAQNNHNMDVSLADISVMAQADGESWNDNIWKRVGNIGGTTFCCCTGGSLTCEWEVECAQHICDSV